MTLPDCDARHANCLFSLRPRAIVGVMREATPEEVAESLSFALLFNGRKRYRQADEMMAKIVAEHLVQHLKRSGYVVMKEPPGGCTDGSVTKPNHGMSGCAYQPEFLSIPIKYGQFLWHVASRVRV
jgi:hypothetical protein